MFHTSKPLFWLFLLPRIIFLSSSSFFLFFINLFIYFWLCWVFVSVRGLSLVAASGGHSSSQCVGLSLSRPLLLRSTGSRCAGSVVVAHGPSCSAACGIFPDQGSNPCPLCWQADSQPLHHQESPLLFFTWLKPTHPPSFSSDSVFCLFVFLFRMPPLILQSQNIYPDSRQFRGGKPLVHLFLVSRT